MTLDEVAVSLPNGFHDAEVESIAIDYRRRLVVMQMDVWIGTMDDSDGSPETYRRAELTIEGFHYCAMDLPDERYPFATSDSLRVDLAEPTAFASPGATFTSRFWVDEWNAFIHLSADAASLRWLGEPVDRSGGLKM